jgi:hypothetical protein
MGRKFLRDFKYELASRNGSIFHNGSSLQLYVMSSPTYPVASGEQAEAQVNELLKIVAVGIGAPN